MSIQLDDGGGSSTFLFNTSTADVVGDGYDALGNQYIVLRFVAYLTPSYMNCFYILFETYCTYSSTSCMTYGSAAVPADVGEINAISCCRIDGLVGGLDDYALDDFRFAVNYVPGVSSSIVIQAPAIMLIDKATSSGGYNYTFVPAISSHGASISCSINTNLADTVPGELTASTVSGGCSCRIPTYLDSYLLGTVLIRKVRATPFAGTPKI
ncbi:hypothetical protein VOLCADRAFT_99180 [Volvox carteri f. nagariensis]|uniref:Pherophorin domain-containing protein n=1 Tax=Volvox carteri f. nagariensis TaxID=3068 RepID=D8UH68_VOLCA|nr:uncharacterized protein VOLCADRAFT_99180 [Volvox carteri f. nagariensis]EFJ40948.1 hypothetical protein VOLCADRAFT_99180 [Volvox carteri f. nagariensis]|eukprot:XP_002958015.1 hypothetical protein VOLCADRAFT_99180 [Volvox carteri f. nagariensis]